MIQNIPVSYIDLMVWWMVLTGHIITQW